MSQSFLYKIDPRQWEENQQYLAGRESILRTISYFDIFQYPLTCDEIRRFSGKKLPEELFLECLRQLLEEKKIFFFDDVYSLQDNPLLHHKRIQGNQRAERLLVKAKRTGRFLYQFPFVTAVGISGSLSKNYADDKADFDFFIITKPNRLWIARTIMHLFKKLSFLVGRQHHFCMNYYIDEEAMLISDQNIFTAIEIKTLLPVAGESTIKKFFGENLWSENFLPSCKFRNLERGDRSKSLLKRTFEKCSGFDGLNRYFFRITSRRWKHKAERGLRNRKGIPMGLDASLHIAKANPGGFQEKLLIMYEERLKQVL